MNIPPGGLDEHLGRLSKSRREACRRERRKASTAGVEVIRMPVADAPTAELAQLESALLHKYGTEWSPASALGWFERIAEITPNESSILVAYADGAPRGFVVIYEYAGQWTLRQAGFDYRWQEDTGTPLYFETIFYRAIEEAFAADVARLHYGLGSTETKRSRGCDLVRQRCWFKTLGSGASR
jgi:predicted N-acyltransferase